MDHIFRLRSSAKEKTVCHVAKGNTDVLPSRPSGLVFVLVITLVWLVWPASAQRRSVEASLKPGDPWKTQPVRTLDDLPASLRSGIDEPRSRFGGWLAQKLPATGFFYTTNHLGRWWLVDPEGCLLLQAGVASVKTIPTPGAREALRRKFVDESGWATATTTLLRSNGFNAVGCWGDTDQLRSVSNPIPYTRVWNFMSSYGRRRGGTFQQPGHTGYPQDCIFVFDPEFKTFCDEHARQLAAGKDDPYLLGHFTDNELPFKRAALQNYLALPATDAGHRAARDFLTQRHGPAATNRDITETDQRDFQRLVVSRYFELVAGAIRKHDPNHLVLGSRFYGADLNNPEVFAACGPHLDVVAVNWYRSWSADAGKLAMWSRESGRPVLITEWYAKAVDSGMANTSGAGWLVKTQRDRGWFYEHFVLGLLESPHCVGWHWFRYSDNDPADKSVDPSNRDSNKGIVNNRYEPYPPLLESMRRINTRLYGISRYFSDAPAKPAGG